MLSGSRFRICTNRVRVGLGSRPAAPPPHPPRPPPSPCLPASTLQENKKQRANHKTYWEECFQGIGLGSAEVRVGVGLGLV